MTAEEVAEALKLPPSTVYQYARLGEIPAFKIGKHWRFRRETLKAHIDKAMQGGIVLDIP